MSRAVIVAVLCLIAGQVAAIDASDRYRSPRNPERKVRASTELIVLHTTEAPARGSLNKLSDRGECHFCVTEDGNVYRIVDRDKEAFHAGRSMWNGKEDVDKFSIGIECVGYHDRKMPLGQLKAIAALVKELKSMYHLSDERVVCHSHVAYGAPNRWQKHRHRGRKRCGMLFAMPSVRAVLGLKARPRADEDVKAGRLVVGDAYLRKVLYGNVDTMKAAYPKQTPVPSPAAGSLLNWSRSKAQATKRRSSVPTAPRNQAELKARGYVLRGEVSKTRTAAMIAGAKWNAPDTYYTIRDKVIPGNRIDPAHIEKGMGVWLKKKR